MIALSYTELHIVPRRVFLSRLSASYPVEKRRYEASVYREVLRCERRHAVCHMLRTEGCLCGLPRSYVHFFFVIDRRHHALYLYIRSAFISLGGLIRERSEPVFYSLVKLVVKSPDISRNSRMFGRCDIRISRSYAVYGAKRRFKRVFISADYGLYLFYQRCCTDYRIHGHLRHRWRELLFRLS